MKEHEMMDKIIFLDRDGVINADSPDYVKSWDEFNFLPGSLQALAELTQAGYRLIIITNQSIIGREMVPLSVLEEMHRRMQHAVESAGGAIYDIFFCPHRPDDQCECRKPRPGMILEAGRRHRIDLGKTVMIGDRAKDVMCGRNAGCGATILVRTGSGEAARQELTACGVQPDAVAADLREAAHLIVSGKIECR
jgi:D-glycero-D-manno-heptose 1,7-bisphosphate phosphatase